MAQLIPVDHDPFAGIDESRVPFGAMSPSEIPQGSLQGRVLQSLTTDMAAAPINAIQQFMDTGSPEASFNVATSLAGGGMAGAEKGAVGALGGDLRRVRPTQSLFPPGFADKVAARIELSRSQRLIDKYYAKEQARGEGGPALSAEERAEWLSAFGTKQKAQDYLVNTQGPPELIPVDHDPFFGSQENLSSNTRSREIEPSNLTFRENMQNRIAEVSKSFPEGEGYPPIVTIETQHGPLILDGHNRAAVAAVRGDKLRHVSISEDEYDMLRKAGFDDMEISYGVLTRAGEDEQASNIAQQFPGSSVASRGMKAFGLLP